MISVMLILQLILDTPIYDRGTFAAETIRLGPVAESIYLASASDAKYKHGEKNAKPIHMSEMISALIALATLESHWAEYVLSGNCKSGRWKCDIDKFGKVQSVGPWQLQRRACKKAHELGPRSYTVQAQCAAKLLRYFRNLCGSWSGAFAAYGGRRCDQPTDRDKSKEVLRQKVERRLKEKVKAFSRSQKSKEKSGK